MRKPYDALNALLLPIFVVRSSIGRANVKKKEINKWWDGADVKIDLRPEEGLVRIEVTVKCNAQTGAEMEALTGAAVAALTVYDMCKGIEPGIVIERV